MIIGLGQLDIVWENKEINKQKCLNMIKEASSNGANLLIFPEMTLTGFSMNTSLIGETTATSETIDFFKKLSTDYNIAIGFGYVEVGDTCASDICKAKNRFVVVRKGEVVMNYAKIHPFTYGDEGHFYEGGNSLESFSIGGFNFGGFICYDLRFPEIFQASSIRNHALIIIANWPKPRVDHFRTLLKARAIENQCYVIGVNRVGCNRVDINRNDINIAGVSDDLGDELSYEGSSGIYSPTGELITKEVNYEKLIIGEISIDVVNECRSVFNHRADKKPELYKTFY